MNRKNPSNHQTRKMPQTLRGFILLAGCLFTHQLTAQTAFSLGERYALVVGGMGGQKEYSEKYFAQTSQMVDLLVNKFEYQPDNVLYLFEEPAFDSLRIDYAATGENVRRAFYHLKRKMTEQDQLFVFLVGHGTFDGTFSKFNLKGPDLKDIEFGELLANLPSKKIVLVNTASASGPFIQKLSGEHRVLITATKSGLEKYETNFADFFLEALASDAADINKDNRISMLEAFKYAKTSQDQWFEEKRQIRAEHPLLDDNGDGEGSQEPTDAKDGRWASRVYLGPLSTELEKTLNRAESGSLTATDSLGIEKLKLEQAIEELKVKKDLLKPETYSQQLETLLIRLAKINRRLKAARSENK
ncbi:MAG: C13 family peptidase [bacterium]